MQEAERQIAQKIKDDGKVLLCAINIPLAKFETDFTAFRSVHPNHALMPQLADLFSKGNDLKSKASEAMSGGAPVGVTKDETKLWLADIRNNSKVMSALAKSK